MFSSTLANIVSTRTTVMTLVFITCYLLPWYYLFLNKLISCIPFFNLLYLHELQAFKYHLNYRSHITVFSCHMMFLTASRMFVMGDVWNVGCLRCGMFRMWNVCNVGCWECGMFKVWDVGCGMFAGMWDDGLPNTIIYCC